MQKSSSNETYKKTHDADNIKSSSWASSVFELYKPRVMSLVVFTCIAGIAVAPDTPSFSYISAVMTVLFVSLGAGASGVLNMWYDADIDAVMQRTKGRPLPTGRVKPHHALWIGIISSLIAVLLQTFLVNLLSGLLLLIAVLYYVIIYTMWLKRNTTQNIVIGGAAGAFPPMIGWAAVTNDLSLLPCLMFLIIFLWTPPHFWALNLFIKTDYDKANIPMLPNIHGPLCTKIEMLVYSILLCMTVFTTYFLFFDHWFLLISMVILNGLLLFENLQLFWTKNVEATAKKMFFTSIIYLFALFSAFIIVQ